MAFGLFVFCNFFVFDLISVFGYKSYFSLNWTDIAKQINLNEFTGGLLTCVAGKYDQGAKLTQNFSELTCPIGQKLAQTTTSANLASELWEIKIDTAAEYTCLNPDCASALRLAMSTIVLQPIGYLGKLAILSVFSMGLSIHTRVVENHFKNWYNVAFCGLALLGTTGFGVYELVARKTIPL